MWLSVNCWEKTRRYERREKASDGPTRQRNRQPSPMHFLRLLRIPAQRGSDALQSKPKRLRGQRSAGRVQSAGENNPQGGAGGQPTGKKAQKVQSKSGDSQQEGGGQGFLPVMAPPNPTTAPVAALVGADTTVVGASDSSWTCSWKHVALNPGCPPSFKPDRSQPLQACGVAAVPVLLVYQLESYIQKLNHQKKTQVFILKLSQFSKSTGKLKIEAVMMPWLEGKTENRESWRKCERKRETPGTSNQTCGQKDGPEEGKERKEEDVKREERRLPQ